MHIQHREVIITLIAVLQKALLIPRVTPLARLLLALRIVRQLHYVSVPRIA
jgi:hypothetical protein